MSLAASERTSLAKVGATVHSRSAWALMAAIIRGCWWPRFKLTSWDEKSMNSLPSLSQNRAPSPPAKGMGSMSSCADHEWKTCSRSAAVDSALLPMAAPWIVANACNRLHASGAPRGCTTCP
ncbi:MAG: hypothetical protein M5U19_10920 [Microthrixaceae bacterium]|nr:hypothetical protein [Microthrixaceae bacterium]